MPSSEGWTSWSSGNTRLDRTLRLIHRGHAPVRHFGPRPLIEDGSVRSRASTLVNGTLGYDFGNGLRLAVEAFNLLDEDASDIDYYYESRLPGEAEPVEDIHFHPAEPRSARLVIEWRY